jgi:hypothetical protein
MNPDKAEEAEFEMQWASMGAMAGSLSPRGCLTVAMGTFQGALENSIGRSKRQENARVQNEKKNRPLLMYFNRQCHKR